MSGSVCKDEIYLVTHNDNSLFRKWILMSYTETGKRHDHELNFYLTDANNNRQLKYKEDRNDMTVTFRTCSESNQIIQRGSGFRLVTYYSGEGHMSHGMGFPTMWYFDKYIIRACAASF